MDPRCYPYWNFHLYYVWLVFQVRDWRKNCHKKCGMSPLSPVSLGNISHDVMSVSWKKWEDGVWNQGTFRIILFIDTIRRNYTRSYNIHSFFLLRCRCNPRKIYLSRSHKLADTDPAGTLDSCSKKTNIKIHRMMWLS